MVRKHGWQLPAHTFQVVAITVFCLLVVAFYAFFAPFLGGRTWEYILVATYSPVALLVFILYVRCTAINPADPGIMSTFDPAVTNKLNTNNQLSVKDLSRKFDEIASRENLSSPSSASRSSIAGANSSKKGSIKEIREVNIPLESTSRNSCSKIEGFFCALFVHEDCRKQEGAAEEQGTGEDALFCTLCNAEVRKFSKHCRSCDKCVDGFDHHCRWLNNCVGHKNYATFIALMAISLLWLVIEAGVGTAVLVLCFVHKKSMEAEIIDRLGNGFTRPPLATVVAVCTVVSMLACIPLGELFFFHILLIRKGITTYEFVMAMRAMSEPQGGVSIDEGLANIMYSPSGVFVDYQDEVVPHLEPGMVPSTVDPDATGIAERGPKLPKRPVRISAWKLAKLDSNEAMRAAAKARASSSVLRPVDDCHLQDPDLRSSGNMSIISSVSTEMGSNKEIKNDMRLSSLRKSFAPSQGSRDEYETGTQSVSSFSSPSHVHEAVSLSPLPQGHGLGRFSAVSSFPNLVHDPPLTSKASFPNVNTSTSHPLGSDEKTMQKGSTDALLLSAPATSILRDIKRTSVVWDEEAGRYMSIPVSASEARNKSSTQIGLPSSSAETSIYNRRPFFPLQESSSSAAKALVPQAEKLMYTGDSIFFGGPLLSLPVRENLKNERMLGSRECQERLALNLSRESRFKRDSTSNQLPVFVPISFEHKPPSGSGS
ncbi:hypothetical protein I3843_03G107400 [Carya illinoinensis]|uniref:S-acyltransferase n=1 Tax=Carya illinoinensis TaxID=32201 RepID=A0A922FJI5_CARIL|nr:hypothetical protein I3842_03G108200 [Carya illinoinensis]KAG7986939.1 hypothetical protein I3843_03G107400 [Carya illinoinensis]